MRLTPLSPPPCELPKQIWRAKVSIFAYDGKCKVADAYKNLTKEVLDIAAREKARFRDDGSR